MLPGSYECLGCQGVLPGSYQCLGCQGVLPGSYQCLGCQGVLPGSYQCPRGSQCLHLQGHAVQLFLDILPLKIRASCL